MCLCKYRHEVIDLILHHRTLSKSKTTFIDGLLEFAVKKRGICSRNTLSRCTYFNSRS